MLTLLESLLPAVMAGFLLVRVEARDKSCLRHLRRVAWTAKGSVRMRRAFLGTDCRLHRGRRVALHQVASRRCQRQPSHRLIKDAAPALPNSAALVRLNHACPFPVRR